MVAEEVLIAAEVAEASEVAEAEDSEAVIVAGKVSLVLCFAFPFDILL